MWCCRHFAAPYVCHCQSAVGKGSDEAGQCRRPGIKKTSEILSSHHCTSGMNPDLSEAQIRLLRVRVRSVGRLSSQTIRR